MARNTEWSLIAYLSQSKYGKYGNSNYSGENKEIYQNKHSGCLTGYSNGTPSVSGDGSTSQTYYNVSPGGTGASTTGTIYGIYDTSGGAWEYVMAAAAVGSSGYSSLPSTVYLDQFTTTYNINTGCSGQNLNTTAGWYGDSNDFVTSTYPWLMRGGNYGRNTTAGMFAFAFVTGEARDNTSARVVLSTW